MTPSGSPSAHTPKPELLAPAGSWESALAALEAGADALYVGLKHWSARARAANFELGDLRRLVPLAHAEGRRVYVAMNTLLKEAEVPAAAEAVWALACQGVDALIVQDLGLWHACRKAFPEVALHASTQMAVHNSAGVRQLEAMGFRRVVLARECTIPEIAEIRRRSTLPLEAFVHGALCFSVSGLCLASSTLAGRSANRGLCAQACRWGYKGAPGKPEIHPFSASDLSLVDRAWDLSRAGVSSLKIEGRLKGADYVHGVVRAYRKVLDAPESDREGTLGAAREILRGLAGRRTTEGFAVHPRPKAVLARGADPTWGTPVGRVVRWKDGTLTLHVEAPVARGDRLRLVGNAPGGGEGTSLVLREFRREKVPRGTRLTLSCRDPARRGDRVYRAKTARGEELEQRMAQKLRSLEGPQGLPLALTVGLADGVLAVAARCGPVEVRRTFEVETHPAEAHPLEPGVLERHLGRLGSSPFYLLTLRAAGRLPPVVIPPSAFKVVRAGLVEALGAELAAEGRRRLETVAALRAGPPAAPVRGGHLWVRGEAPRTLRATERLPVQGLVAAANRDTLSARSKLAEALGSPKRLAWELPAWIEEGELEAYHRDLEALAREGYHDLWVTNPAHLELARGLGLRLRGGWELNALNGWAAAALAELGLSSFVPSPEGDAQNLASIARGGWPLRPVCLAYGSLPLFTTRLEPAPHSRPEAESADGRRLRWSPAPSPHGRGWHRVYGPEPLCWAGRMEELRALGVADFLIDFQGRPFTEAEVKAVVTTVDRGQRLPGSTEANYERGLA